MAREFGISPHTVRALGRSALRRDALGRYRVKPKDDLLRVLIIPGPDGLREVAVDDSQTASKIGQYSDAVQNISGQETQPVSRNSRASG